MSRRTRISQNSNPDPSYAEEQIVEFCGMKLEQCNIYGGVDTSGKSVKKILTDVKKKV